MARAGQADTSAPPTCLGMEWRRTSHSFARRSRVYLLIHVEGGTITRSWTFDTKARRDKFLDDHKSTEDDGETSLRYLPNGTFDDPATCTWIEVEAVGVQTVDGERPTWVRSE